MAATLRVELPPSLSEDEARLLFAVKLYAGGKATLDPASIQVSPTSIRLSTGRPRRSARTRRPVGSGFRVGRLSPPRISRKKEVSPRPSRTRRESASPLLLSRASG